MSESDDFENEDLLNLSFSQCAITLICTQTFDSNDLILDKNTEEIHLLCDDLEEISTPISNSQTEDLFGFEKGNPVCKRRAQAKAETISERNNESDKQTIILEVKEEKEDKEVIEEKSIIENSINTYIEKKIKKRTRGRPLIINHKTPNFTTIRSADKLKYVKNRYKNNIASQRSRIKRTLKGKEQKQELQKLEQRNKELKLEKETLKKELKMLSQTKCK